jgi:hypothetical protein
MSSQLTFLPTDGDLPTARMGGTKGDIPLIHLATKYSANFFDVNLGCHDDPAGWLLELAKQATRLAAEYQHALRMVARAESRRVAP